MPTINLASDPYQGQKVVAPFPKSVATQPLDAEASEKQPLSATQGFNALSRRGNVRRSGIGGDNTSIRWRIAGGVGANSGPSHAGVR
jgi:hypothetical protein